LLQPVAEIKLKGARLSDVLRLSAFVAILALDPSRRSGELTALHVAYENDVRILEIQNFVTRRCYSQTTCRHRLAKLDGQ